MGNQLISFISNHLGLCLAFTGILALVFINEYITQKQGPKALTPDDLIHAMNKLNASVIDVRELAPFQQGHITGSKHLAGATENKLTKYKDKPFVLVCARGLQSSGTAAKLKKAGFEQVMFLSGGITAWKTANLPLTKGKK